MASSDCSTFSPRLSQILSLMILRVMSVVVLSIYTDDCDDSTSSENDFSNSSSTSWSTRSCAEKYRQQSEFDSPLYSGANLYKYPGQLYSCLPVCSYIGIASLIKHSRYPYK